MLSHYLLLAVAGFLIFGGIGYYLSSGDALLSGILIVIGLLNLLRARSLVR